MSQARVTDFFSQRKKGLAAPEKAAKQRTTRGSCRTNSRTITTENKDAFLCPSNVREEFVRVIDEAVGLNDGDSAFISNTGKASASSPRTPKRSSADAEFDLGAAVFSATADHSTAKKRRQAEAAKTNIPEQTTTRRRTARKKLVLPEEVPQVMMCFCSHLRQIDAW